MMDFINAYELGPGLVYVVGLAVTLVLAAWFESDDEDSQAVMIMACLMWPVMIPATLVFMPFFGLYMLTRKIKGMFE